MLGQNNVSVLNSAVKTILGSNAKLSKVPNGETVLVQGISMAPSRRSGVQVCKHASPACIAACVLWFAGRTVTDVVRNAAIARTRLWAFAADIFYARLRSELVKMVRKASKLGARPFVRFNVASDIDHESTGICTEFPTITFYDYTKDWLRYCDYLQGSLPPNYSLSFSVSENTNFEQVRYAYGLNGNLVVVFDAVYNPQSKKFGALPESVTFTGSNGQSITMPVVDGDVHDIRTPEFDGIGKVVGLRAKGTLKSKATGIARGFIKPLEPVQTAIIASEFVQSGNCIVRLPS